MYFEIPTDKRPNTVMTVKSSDSHIVTTLIDGKDNVIILGQKFPLSMPRVYLNKFIEKHMSVYKAKTTITWIDEKVLDK